MSVRSALIITGTIWKFGDNINTDLIFPHASFDLPSKDQHKMVFDAIRPGWVDMVKQGDLLVVGHNFGMGSGRPIGKMLSRCGIAGVIAESFNGLGHRNCVNFALPAIECLGVSLLFEEGQTAEVDFGTGFVCNISTNRTLQGVKMPDLFIDIVAAGGVIPMLVREGFIEEQPIKVVSR